MSPTAEQNGTDSSSIHTIPLLIDNKPQTSSKTFPVHSPSNGAHLHNCSSASSADIERVLTSAQSAFPAWRTVRPPQKRDIFLRAAELFLSEKQTLIDAIVTETGATVDWAEFNLRLAREIILDVAGRIATISGSIPATAVPGTSALIYTEPYGVILAIAPWNAPYILGVRSIAYALGAGNCVVAKAPEFSPLCSYHICRIFQEAGLPEGVLSFVAHSPSDAAEVTKQLIESPIIKKINFTGSTRVGRIIAETAGRALKPVLLELGGKASTIVWEDAELEFAARECARGAFKHAGQICMSTERLLVHEGILEKFEKAFTAATQELYPGPETLINAPSVSKTQSLIDDAVSKGARIIHPAEASPPSENSTTMTATILTSITPEMDIYRTESFGPSVSLIPFKTEEEAIRIANDTEYGLSCGIFTENLALALRIAKSVESGAVHINGVNASVHDEAGLPHGGFKDSGWGRFGAVGLEEWVRSKTVTFRD
ncbi:aldehyde dehydrogenase protein [Rutstroemia sp. NJR-2017a WRK4]|nr:aldehyde dehydrogenase protein [Rutstroemia sp. NJR-2017a WRK4]